ncbi:hypothetical protein YC2023_038597 [Brassica napus]
MTVLSSSNCENRLATEGKGLLPTSETIKPFNMSSRCSAVDNMGMVNRDVEADDELKSCSCSFCRKVTRTRTWSDLHYQDIKGGKSSHYTPKLGVDL